MKPVLHLSLRADHGGGPAHLLMLMQAMPADARLFVACPREEPYWGRFAALLGEERLFELPHRSFSIVHLVRLVRFIRRHRIGLLHSHGKGAGMYSRPLRVMTGMPCVHTFHGLHVGNYGAVATWGYLHLERALSQVTAATIAVSPGEADEWRCRARLDAEKLHIILNGVPAPARREAVVADETVFTICTITRFDAMKNSALALRIFLALCRRLPDQRLRLLVMGDGPGRAALEQEAQKSPMAASVVFTGNTPAVRELLAASQAYLSSSRWEGLPLALIEAAMEGVPLVVSDVVGNRDVVRLIGGATFNLDDPEAAVEHLAALVADRPAARRAGAIAAVKAQRIFGVHRMALETVRCYRAALTRGGTRIRIREVVRQHR